MGVFVRNHVHETVLDVWLQPGHGGESFEADHDTLGVSHAYGFSPADGGSLPEEIPPRDKAVPASAARPSPGAAPPQESQRTPGVSIDLRMLGDSFGY